MLGVNLVPDVPPMYLLQPVLVTSFSLIYADMGAISVIALAAKAYHRFSRDLALNNVSAIISNNDSKNADGLSESIKSALPKISSLTGASRVSILMNFPFSRPIIHRYVNEQVVTFDDGKIPGAVTIRAFVYGDEAWP